MRLKLLGGKAPIRATPGSAGLDLFSRTDIIVPGFQCMNYICPDCRDSVKVHVPGRAVVPVGFAMALELGTEAQIRPRSGLAVRLGITVLNSPGTVDGDYRDEVGVVLINHGGKSFVIREGDKIAQMVLAKYVWDEPLVFVTELEETQRKGGFGSTGNM